MFRIAVISDLHIDKRREPRSWDIAQAAFRAATPADHVLVAGDLFDSASAMRSDRAAVKRMLRQFGIWHPERITFTVGNHDIFEVGHRGHPGHRVLDGLRALGARAQANLDLVSDWFGELVPQRDRLFSNALFPYKRSLEGTTIVAADSTASDTLASAQGSWTPEEDQGVRCLFRRTRGARLLAIHNPPEEEGGELSLIERVQGYVDGFPGDDFERLKRLADDLRLSAVLAGHVHEADRWSWTLGAGTKVHVMGRTGGLCSAPILGFIDFPKSGKLRWCTAKLEDSSRRNPAAARSRGA